MEAELHNLLAPGVLTLSEEYLPLSLIKGREQRKGDMMTQQQPLPKREIRRFDIFAEWNRLKGRTKAGLGEADARAYGLAVAKVVAARKFAGYEPAQTKEFKRRAKEEEVGEPWWEHLGSAEEFARKVIARMSEAFYSEVFQPSVLEAWESGQRYEEIRDNLREPWNRQLRDEATAVDRAVGSSGPTDKEPQERRAQGDGSVVQAVCGLCGAPLLEGRDDLYAELCATCGQRQLKGRQRGKRGTGRRRQNESALPH